jgi:hypothetical protein
MLLVQPFRLPLALFLLTLGSGLPVTTEPSDLFVLATCSSFPSPLGITIPNYTLSYYHTPTTNLTYPLLTRPSVPLSLVSFPDLIYSILLQRDIKPTVYIAEHNFTVLLDKGIYDNTIKLGPVSGSKVGTAVWGDEELGWFAGVRSSADGDVASEQGCLLMAYCL